MDGLQNLGAQVDYHDPHIPEITPTREHAAWTGKQSVVFNPDTIATYDAVIIATYHTAFDLKLLVEHASLIVDTRNALENENISGSKGQVYKA